MYWSSPTPYLHLHATNYQNSFLAGFVPTENLRFREEALVFKISQTADEFGSVDRTAQYRYPSMTKTMVPKAVRARLDGSMDRVVQSCVNRHAISSSSLSHCLDTRLTYL